MKKIGEDGTLSRESRENFHTDGNRINFNSLGGVEKQMNSEMRDLSHQRSEKSKIKYYLLGIDSTPNIFSYSTDRFYSNLKSGYENAVLAALTLWNNLKVRENEDFPFEKSTWIYKFYCSVFPYVILMSFIILFVVLYYSVNGILSLLFSKKGNFLFTIVELPNDCKKPYTAMTQPDKIINNKPLPPGISLKGRTKKVPKSINYSELFNHSEQVEVNVKKNNLESLSKENNRSIDDFFESIHIHHKLEMGSQNIIPDNNKNLIDFDGNKKDKIREVKTNYTPIKKESLYSIKEEDDEAQENQRFSLMSKLFNRNNYAS